MKEQIPVLIGEAAKSWVELQWYEFYMAAGFLAVVAIGILIFLLKMDKW